MPVYKYAVRVRLSDDTESYKVFKAATPSKAMQLMLMYLRRDHDRGDVKSICLDGDPMPVNEADRKRTIKQRKAERLAEYSGTYSGTTKIR